MVYAYCNDWNCPAKVSCKHAAIRSEPFNGGKPFAVHPFERQAGADACEAYQQDVARPWLMAAQQRPAAL